MAKVKQVKYKINLQDLFGMKFPKDQELRDTIAQEILDRIKQNTQSGKDKDGNRFAPYSKEYAKRKGSSKVDMTLTGDMLETMDILDASSQTVTLGFPDEIENAKAFNHTTGDTLPKRDFFGLPEKDLKAIRDLYMNDVADARAREKAGVKVDQPGRDSQFDSLIQAILSGEFDSDLGIS